MKKQFYILFIFLGFSSITIAQETKSENTLEDQFTRVIDKSNNYQQYKVVEKAKLARLEKSILDTVASLEKTINDANKVINTQKNEISSLKKDLGDTQTSLATSIEKEDGIELFGILMKKSTYNAILWGIIGVLILGLLIFIYKFKNSNVVTKDAKHKLAETEAEFEAHRAKKLEEIQQIRRKLQDELNKNKKS